MNRIKLLVLSACSMALLASAPFDLMAGLNRNAPGLPVATYNTTLVGNNGFSSMCVDCHGRNPLSGSTTYGSHFVSLSPAAASTNSGGGWDCTAGGLSQSGPRKNGAYFKINQWPSGGYSKYGDASTDNSYSTSSIGNYTGIVVDNASASTYATREIICESCHNILVNAAGGNNLLATPVLQSAAAAEATSGIPNLCVGCHGDMYSVNAANTNIGGTHATKYADARNTNEVAGGKKGVNSVHYINGVLYNMNHHVTTGDSVDNTTVGVGLTWRDTLSIDPKALLVPVSSTPAGLTRGQMPQLATWLDGKVKPPTAVDCLNCHTHGHGGSQYTGASILRDTTQLTAAVPAESAIDKGVARIGEYSRKWMDINDVPYCNDCHTVAGAR